MVLFGRVGRWMGGLMGGCFAYGVLRGASSMLLARLRGWMMVLVLGLEGFVLGWLPIYGAAQGGGW